MVLDHFLDYLSDELEREFDRDHFYHYRDHDAVSHFFRVASSLDSMVLGETEIMKQIKDQSAAALAHRNKGRRLKSLVDVALWTAKQVRSRTAINQNVVSMSSLAYREVCRHVAYRNRKRVVFVGAGHFIQSLMPTFAKGTDLEFIFVNRTLPVGLAAQYGGRAIGLDDFLAEPVPFDALVTATGASRALFDKAWFERHGGERQLLLLDAGLPADIDADVRELEHVELLDLACMEEILAVNRAAREAEIPKAGPIFVEGLDKLRNHWLECDLSNYSREISSHYRAAGERALSHLLKECLPQLSDQDQTVLHEWTQSLVGKLTNVPILGLKGVAKDIGEPAVEAFTRQVASKAKLFR
jgi:glutamyl-tRNA reductase